MKRPVVGSPQNTDAGLQFRGRAQENAAPGRRELAAMEGGNGKGRAGGGMITNLDGSMHPGRESPRAAVSVRPECRRNQTRAGATLRGAVRSTRHLRRDARPLTCRTLMAFSPNAKRCNSHVASKTAIRLSADAANDQRRARSSRRRLRSARPVTPLVNTSSTSRPTR